MAVEERGSVGDGGRLGSAELEPAWTIQLDQSWTTIKYLRESYWHWQCKIIPPLTGMEPCAQVDSMTDKFKSD